MDEIAPPPDHYVARLCRLDCCAFSDALDALGLPGAITGVPQQSGRGRMAGRAVTLRVGIGDPAQGPKRHLGTTAIESSPPGGVIVIEQRSGIDAARWGGLLTLAAKLRGLAGAVIDGPMRDIDEAIGHEWPIFARKLTARGPRADAS
jgi:4-hydroxy-4-methyl-2-oxoglutarate aldolase